MNTVLCIEDNRVTMTLLTGVLKSAGYQTESAANGADAIEVLKNSPGKISAVLLDQMLPDGDGLDFFQEIRAIDPNLPVIMVTAHGSVPLAVAFMRQGGFDFIEKPVSADMLVICVSRAIAFCEGQKKLSQTMEENRVLREEKSGAVQMITMAAHELRSPISSAIGLIRISLLRLLKLSGSVDPETRASHEEQMRSCLTRSIGCLEYLIETTVKIMDISRLEAGAMTYSMDTFPIDRIIRNAVDHLGGFAHEKGVRLSVESGEISIEADSLRIEQVIYNVVGNAIKFSDGGGHVRIEVEQWEDSVRISVSDEGIGIPEDQLELIFDKFSQSRLTAGRQGSNGLGLAICREIVRAHRGTIEARNNANGSTFEISLPFVQTKTIA